MSKAITLPDGSKIDWLNKDWTTFLDKSIILYGASGSGKTSIMINILYAIRNHIAYPFIITKSLASAEANYYGRVPKGCIKTNISKEWLELFHKKQTIRTQIYKTVNLLANLKIVFDMIESPKAKKLEQDIINDAERCIQIIGNNHDMPFPKKKLLICDIKKTKDNVLVHLYKTVIRAHKVELEAIFNEMTRESKIVITYLDFLPHALLVFDDCAFMFKQWTKESTAIKELFYQGRHIFTTVIVGTQGDTELCPEIRMNANISIFTSSQEVGRSFSKSSNGYPDYYRKRAMLCCNSIFSDTSDTKNYQKLVYLRDDSANPFKYTIADIFDEDFKIGADAVWDLDRVLNPSTQDTLAKTFDEYLM